MTVGVFTDKASGEGFRVAIYTPEGAFEKKGIQGDALLREGGGMLYSELVELSPEELADYIDDADALREADEFSDRRQMIPFVDIPVFPPLPAPTGSGGGATPTGGGAATGSPIVDEEAELTVASRQVV